MGVGTGGAEAGSGALYTCGSRTTGAGTGASVTPGKGMPGKGARAFAAVMGCTEGLELLATATRLTDAALFSRLTGCAEVSAARASNICVSGAGNGVAAGVAVTGEAEAAGLALSKLAESGVALGEASAVSLSVGNDGCLAN